MGLEPKENSFCYWLEFKTETLGSISGGNTFKHIGFFSKKRNEWGYDPEYTDKNDAFEHVRRGIVALVQLAAEGQYEQLESVEPFKGKDLTRGKILFLYYPDRFLPIDSIAHLKEFCLQLGVAANFDSQIDMNRALLQFKEVRKHALSAVGCEPESPQWWPR